MEADCCVVVFLQFLSSSCETAFLVTVYCNGDLLNDVYCNADIAEKSKLRM